MSTNDVPDEWIEPQSASMGFLPDVGVHVRGELVIQETSRSVWVGAVVMSCLAVLALIPAGQFRIVLPYYVQVVVAIGLVWGAVCAVVGSRWISKLFGTTVIVDRKSQLITLRRDGETRTIPLGYVIGLQFLKGPRDCGGYQLNLAFRTESGEIEREMLVTNATRFYVTRIANAYQKVLDWPLLQSKTEPADF